MVDKVCPLKIEQPGKGTQFDFGPKEANPTEDYLAAKGIALENSDDTLIDLNSSEIAFTDTVNGTKRVSQLLDAEEENFDPTGTTLSSTKTGPAIRELANSITSNDFAFFAIWAEENAALGDNQREWSFGNGATGDIGIVLPVDAQLFAVSYNADVAGTNTEVAVVQNTSTQIGTTGLQSGEDGFNTLLTPAAVSAGDRIGFQTLTAGGASDVRVTAWFRVPSSLLIDLGLGELNDVNITAPANGEVLTYNGSNWENASLPSAPVDSVNGQTGVVVLDADDIDDSLTTNKFATQAELDQIATNQTNISTNSSNISELELNQDDLITLSGVPENSTNLGTFTGITIPDNQNNKQALQALETGLEDHINDTLDAHEASAISYDNSSSGLLATEVQSAIDEVESRVDDAEIDITELELNQDDLVTLSGVPENSTDLGTFTGVTIPDNQNNKQAFQSLETGLETHINDTANPHDTTFTQAVAADPGTDITTAEAEELTDGSTTQLHFHRELVDETSTNRVEVLNGGDVQVSNYPQTRNDTTSNDEKVLTTDNSGNLVLRRVLPFYDSIKKVSDDVSEVGINQTQILEDWLTLSTTIPETGNYDIDWTYVWSFNDSGQDFIAEILLDGSPISTYSQHVQEPKDSAGAGIDLLNTTGGITNSGTNQRHRTAGFEPEVNLSAGVHTITIQWAGSQNNDEATIYEGAIRIKRVS